MPFFQKRLLLWHNVNHGVLCLCVKLAGRGSLYLADVSQKLNDGKLHAKAQSKIRNLARAAELNDANLSLDSPRPETSGHDDTVKLPKFFQGSAILFVGLCGQPGNDGLPVVRPGRMLDGFNDRNIRIHKRKISGPKVFSHDADAYRLLLSGNLIRKTLPVGKPAFARLHAEFLENLVTQILFFKV